MCSKNSSSFQLKGTVSGQNLLSKGLSWRLGNGSEVFYFFFYFFKENCWCNGNIFKVFFGENLNINWNKKLAELFQNGTSNVQALNLINIPMALEMIFEIS